MVLVAVCVDWTGLDWTGLDWTGLDWTGLDWTVCTQSDTVVALVGTPSIDNMHVILYDVFSRSLSST